MDIEKALKLAKELAIQAGEKILEIYNTDFAVEYKSDASPLTLADTRSNEIIVNALANKFPEVAILTEEAKDDKSRLGNDWCFIIDPLDGTKEFIKRNGEFTVNIALAHEHKPVMGVIYVPALDELYYAAENQGAFFMKNHSEPRKITVSKRADNLRLVKSRSHPSKQLEELIAKNADRISEQKVAGSSLKGCLIAKGEAEIYYRFGHTMEWDTCAMHCIVEQAGGIFRQLDDSPLLYNREIPLNEKGFYVLNNEKSKLH